MSADPPRCPACPVAPPLRCPGWGHRRYCQLCDPAHPDYRGEYRALVREVAAAPPEPPGLVARAVNLTHAVVAHAAAGLPTLDAAATAARLAVCHACDRFRPPNTCAVCGCNLSLKSSWADQRCPLHRWPGDPTP